MALFGAKVPKPKPEDELWHSGMGGYNNFRDGPGLVYAPYIPLYITEDIKGEALSLTVRELRAGGRDIDLTKHWTLVRLQA